LQTLPQRAPRMVFSGEFWRGSSGFGLAQGFRKQGWTVHEIDLSRIFGALGNSLTARVVRRIMAPSLLSHFERELRDAISALRPDVLLTIKGTHITRDLLLWMGDQGIKRLMFYPDFHFDHPGVRVDDFAFYDAVFTSKSFHVDFLKAKIGAEKIHYVPHGYSDDVHWPVLGDLTESDYEADVQHIGAHSAYKQGWMEAVQAGMPWARLRVKGARWETAIGDSALRTAELGGSVTDALYSRELQSGRINVAVMMGPHLSGWQDHVSTRTFEIAACGGFMLHIDSEELREFFQPGVELDVFSSPEELVDKASFYLQRPDQRRRMGARAHARCVPAYGYAARSRAIAKALDQVRSS